MKRDPLSAGVKKMSLAKLTNGYAAAAAAAATHKDELLGGYAKSNLYNGVKSGGYAEPPSRPPMPMEEGGCHDNSVCKLVGGVLAFSILI